MPVGLVILSIFMHDIKEVVMGNYAMQQLREVAMRNFIRGIRNFKVFGNVDVQIEHRHANEHGVTIYDPVAQRRYEVLRILDGAQPCFQ